METIGRWALLSLVLSASAAWGQSVGWRGDGTGCFPAAEPPAEWDIDEGTNILWQAKVGKGQSSPVVIGERVFVTAEPDVLVCLDCQTGKLLWKQENGYDALPPSRRPADAKLPRTHEDCGYSTPTPVADKSRIFASFGTGVVVCFDQEGHRQWIQYLDRKLVTDFGRTASPLLTGGKLLVSLGGLLALDPANGEVLWETTEVKPTYGTGAVVSIVGVDMVITPRGDCVRVADGKRLANELGELEYASPIVCEDIVYFVGETTVAWKLENESEQHFKPQELWTSDELEGEFYASPVLHDGVLFTTSNEGTLYALDAKTGELLYQQTLEIRSASGLPGMEPANLYGSPIIAGKHMLLSNDVGESLVLLPSRQYREGSYNYLDTGSAASPVAAGKQLFLRGSENLYCIGEK
jgi:outer membrane protein assembly factor BamB